MAVHHHHHHHHTIFSVFQQKSSVSLFLLATMFPNNGGANNNSRNRNMKEIAVEPNDTNNDLFNLQPQQHLPSPTVTQVQCILNTFMSLITTPYPKDDLDSDIKNQTEHMNQIITYHSENLKHTLARVLENQHRERNLEAEGRAAKKLKEMELGIYAKLTRNAELENLLEFYKWEVARLQCRVRILERTAVSLGKRLREVNVARRYTEREEEDAESSFVDLEWVEPVRLNCKECEREVATMMMWPCRHISVCARCDIANKACLVCGIEVCLPPN